MKPPAMTATLVLAACLTACGVFPPAAEPPFEPPIMEAQYHREPDEVEPVPDPCPPLPRLAKDASRFESRVWTLTLIALYAQCAESKK